MKNGVIVISTPQLLVIMDTNCKKMLFAFYKAALEEPSFPWQRLEDDISRSMKVSDGTNTPERWKYLIKRELNALDNRDFSEAYQSNQDQLKNLNEEELGEQLSEILALYETRQQEKKEGSDSQREELIAKPTVDKLSETTIHNVILVAISNGEPKTGKSQAAASDSQPSPG